MKNELLLQAESYIKAAYAELGHARGFSFLYTPGATLSSHSRLLFMGLNPGGDGDEASISLTTEEGNAYNPAVERNWIGDGKAAPLQTQVVKFYEKLGKKIGYEDTRKLMDSTLAANFCPFRSSSWNALRHQEASIEFSYDLWTRIFQELEITTTICMSSLVFENMGGIAISAGGLETCSVSKPVGWGNVRYRYKKYRMKDRDLLLLCLPHLSRYKIFSSSNCTSHIEEIVDMIASSLEDWIPYQRKAYDSYR